MTSPALATKCSICLLAGPKYKCPRCSVRTCSLACVRTHKARNLCSGIRDPTKFLSRRQLSKPAAFDSDFNLLSSIERGIERAERVFSHTADEGNDSRRSNLTKALSQTGVRVWSAPKGVMRSKENHTCVDGRRKHVTWTIEWKFLGMRVLATASELLSLQDAHDIAVLDAYRAEMLKDRKQMLREYIINTGVSIPSGYHGRKALMLDLGLEKKIQSAMPIEGANHEGNRISSTDIGPVHGRYLKESPKLLEDRDAVPESGQAVAIVGAKIVQAASETSRQCSTYSETINPIRPSRQFFVHRPEISTAQKQIISPCDGNTSLRDVLKGKTVREFPTFVVGVLGMDEINWNHWHLFDEAKSLIVEVLQLT